MSRFLLLFKQHMTHNSKLMLFSSVGYCGVVYIILVFAQVNRDLEPLDLEIFLIHCWFSRLFSVSYTPDTRFQPSEIRKTQSPT